MRLRGRRLITLWHVFCLINEEYSSHLTFNMDTICKVDAKAATYYHSNLYLRDIWMPLVGVVFKNCLCFKKTPVSGVKLSRK